MSDRKAMAINALALVSLVVAVLVRVVFADSGSSIPDATTAANLTSDLAVGYLAAWIVYYLTTWRPRREDRNQALKIAAPAAIRVGGTAQGVLQQLRSITGQTGEAAVTQRELDSLVSGRTTTEPARMVGADGKPVPILQMLLYFRQRAEGFTETVQRLAPYLDAELAVALTHIHECSFFTQLALMADLPSVADLHVLVPSIYEYFLKCDALTELVCVRYGEVVNGQGGLSINAIRQARAANGPLEWRPGSACPWEANSDIASLDP